MNECLVMGWACLFSIFMAWGENKLFLSLVGFEYSTLCLRGEKRLGWILGERRIFANTTCLYPREAQVSYREQFLSAMQQWCIVHEFVCTHVLFLYHCSTRSTSLVPTVVLTLCCDQTRVTGHESCAQTRTDTASIVVIIRYFTEALPHWI